MPFEQQREHFGGQSLAFSWKNPAYLFFLHNRKLVFYVVFGDEKRSPSNFWCPKGTVFIGFSNLSLPSAENREEPNIFCWNYGFCGSKNKSFLFFTLKVGLMYRLKSHLWPACTICRLHKTFKFFCEIWPGQGGRGPGRCPGRQVPKVPDCCTPASFWRPFW